MEHSTPNTVKGNADSMRIIEARPYGPPPTNDPGKRAVLAKLRLI
jgi:hypothetical protein